MRAGRVIPANGCCANTPHRAAAPQVANKRSLHAFNSIGGNNFPKTQAAAWRGVAGRGRAGCGATPYVALPIKRATYAYGTARPVHRAEVLFFRRSILIIPDPCTPVPDVGAWTRRGAPWRGGPAKLGGVHSAQRARRGRPEAGHVRVVAAHPLGATRATRPSATSSPTAAESTRRALV